MPIRSALARGRLCDFFLIVDRVLNTYNPGSAYVELENWSGTACIDCGSIVGEDNRYHCERCGESVCTDCVVNCERCEECFCGQCIALCADCEQPCCGSCLEKCPDCGKDVSPRAESCPGCGSRGRDTRKRSKA